ncbi:MAG: response regulator [Pseudomonadota bacterium]|nr:response regulator [Polaromonas sp.]MDO9259364.1 response regulator [Polaromonas sp.]
MKTILIVDDHPDIRRLLSITLGGEYMVLEAHDGASGLEAVLAHRPQAVLLDVMMPGEFDGLAVLNAIKSNPDMKNTRVVMLTARGQSGDFREGLSRGADAYFVKPFSPLQIVNWLRENLP